MRITLKGVSESASVARHAIRDFLGAGHPVIHEVELCASELVTNSVLHSESREGTLDMLVFDMSPRLTLRSPAIRVVVIDAGGESVPVLKPDSEFSLSGRGLLIVHEYASRWDFSQRDRQTITWFEIDYQTRSRAPDRVG